MPVTRTWTTGAPSPRQAMRVLKITVTDEMVAELGHDGLVELMYAIPVENHRARFNHALGITDQGFTSGGACRLPLRGS
jgi:hypothetical protein